jgi:putative spermidine/putrescine transport system substrate-binding protein
MRERHHHLRRRALLRLGLGAGAVLALPAGLAGCRGGERLELLLTEGELPAGWLRRLPQGWRARSFGEPAAVLTHLRSRAPAEQAAAAAPSLVALGDGWATSTPAAAWQPLQAPALLNRLAPWARAASRLFAGEGEPALAFPWAFSPWVLALRSRPDLAARRAEGWNLLLDPSLRGQLVLPSSPRLCMELMGRNFDRIAALRRQALAHDDRHGLNLLLSGAATAAVLPLRRLLPLLRRDPRLSVVLPDRGAPLSWQLLLRPARSEAPLPLDWIGAALEPPLLEQLLLAGWVPPLPRPALAPLLARMPAAQASLLLPAEPVLQRCWNLAPLSVPERLAHQTVWDAAAGTMP